MLNEKGLHFTTKKQETVIKLLCVYLENKQKEKQTKQNLTTKKI